MKALYFVFLTLFLLGCEDTTLPKTTTPAEVNLKNLQSEDWASKCSVNSDSAPLKGYLAYDALPSSSGTYFRERVYFVDEKCGYDVTFYSDAACSKTVENRKASKCSVDGSGTHTLNGTDFAYAKLSFNIDDITFYQIARADPLKDDSFIIVTGLISQSKHPTELKKVKVFYPE